jgi:hypothetical protein
VTLLIQQFLRSQETSSAFTTLVTQYNIKARRHEKYNNLVLFKYGKIADATQPIVRECRGIILDEANDWAVISRGFDKFANHGETWGAEIDWGSARVQEKVDGSLFVMYHHDGQWHAATSGSPDATGEIRGTGTQSSLDRPTGLSYAKHFWDTFKAQGGRLPAGSDLCFAFELMSPLNRVVVVHDQPKLRLLGVRDRRTGTQFTPDDLAHLVGIESVQTFPITSMADVLASFKDISPVQQEGYVVVDKHFNRLKVKHPGYVELHYMKDKLSLRSFVEAVRIGEQSEGTAVFPEYRDIFESIGVKYANLLRNVNDAYLPLKTIESQRDFADAAKKTPFSATLFAMRKGVSAAEYFETVSTDKLMALLGL